MSYTKKKDKEPKYNSYGERCRWDNWRCFSPDEEYLFYRLGNRGLLRICTHAVNFSCIEAGYLGIKYSEEAFK